MSNHLVDDMDMLEVISSPAITIPWEIAWQELDLIFGLSRVANGEQTLLDPSDYGVVPAGGVQFPNVEVRGSDAGNIIYASSNSFVYGGDNGDTLYSIDGYSGNLLVGEEGSDRFYLAPSSDLVFGGSLIESANSPGLDRYVAEVDSVPDLFYLSNTGFDAADEVSRIGDFHVGVDRVFVDGEERVGEWSSLKADLLQLGFDLNAVPVLQDSLTLISRELLAGEQGLVDLSGAVIDPDEDDLSVVMLSGPEWVSSSGLQIVLAPSSGTSLEQVATFGVHDGHAMALGELQLTVTPEEEPVPLPLPTPVPEPTPTPVPTPDPGSEVSPEPSPSPIGATPNFVGDSSSIEVIQDEQSVRVVSARGAVSIPLGAVDKVTLDNSSLELTRLSVSDTVAGLDVEIAAGALTLEGAQIVDSVFEFSSASGAEFISNAQKLSGTTIVMRKGEDSVQLERGVVRKSFFSTGRGRDAVLLDSAVKIKGNTVFDLGKRGDSVTVDAEIRKATFELGKGADQISIMGDVKKAFVDLGDDVKGDVVTISSSDVISKRVKITNFDKKDQLIVGGERFGYSDLKSGNPDRVSVSFRGETSTIIPDVASDSTASTGFDFI